MLDAIDRARLAANWPKSWATSCCRPSSSRRWPSEAEPVPHRRRARRHQPEAHPAASARLRRRDRRRPRATCKRIWGEVKAEEKAGQGRSRKSLLGPVPRALPALVEAQQIASRAAAVGFDWENAEQVLDKLHEELARVRRGARAAASRDELGGRTGRPAVRAGEPGALREGGSRAGAAQDQCQVPPSASATSSASWRSGARSRADARRRRNGGAVAGSETVIESSASSFARSQTSQECRCGLQKDDLGLRRHRTAAGALFWWWSSKVGGQVFGAYDGERMVGFCFAIPGLKPGGAPYLHSHMLGVLPEYRNCRRRPAAEAAAARGRAGARHRPDRVDLRSAGAQERLLQHRAAGRHRAALRARTSTASPPARCTAACPRTAAYAEWWIASAAGAGAFSTGEPAGARRRSRAHLPCPPTSRASAREDPERAREIQQENGEQLRSAFRARPGRDRASNEVRRPRHLPAGAMAMKIERVTLRQIRMPLVHFFETSFGRTYERDIILVEVRERRRLRLGRSHRRREPVLQRGVDRIGVADPARLRRPARAGPRARRAPTTSAPLTAHIRGHHMARGGLEAAVWDLEARIARRAAVADRSAAARGARFPAASPSAFRIRCEQLLEKIERELAAGYQRIKMKIKPGWDVDVVRAGARALSRHQADGGRQLRLHPGRRRPPAAAGRFLPDDDRAAAGARRHHRPRRAAGQARKRPSAWTNASARRTTPSRPSGCAPAASSTSSWAAWAASREARRVHDVAQAAGIPVWCGGMLEAGIGRAHNIALATLPNFVLPGDVSASRRYWKRDIIQPAVETTRARHHRGPRRARLRLRV